ncbi:MAG: hypothetical protein HYV09_11010 [Deltaproteobacteria bacterium]|nr:hypothetical protein [Deltaproteobacteria bacterium]
MRAYGIASVVTIALSVFAGCAIDGSQSERGADETTGVAQESLSTPHPGRLNIQFGITGYAGGCFKGPGICSIGSSPSPWDANATGVYGSEGVLTLSLDRESTPFDLRASGGLKIEAPIALDAKIARSLGAPGAITIQPGFYAVRSDVDGKGPIVIDVKVTPVKSDADWNSATDEISVYGGRVANPANKFDWVGRLHNKAMVYGRSVLTKGATPEAVDATTAKFIGSVGITVDTTKFFASGANKFSAELFASKAPDELLVKTGKMSPRGASYFVKILDASVNDALSGDYRANKRIEVEIMTDKTLPEQESDVLLATSSVGRYSAAYVLSTGDVEPMQAPPIVKADVSGAVGGAVSGAVGGAVVVPVVGSVPGYVVGGVLGGVGASLGEWVASWF